jgi:hypothetical protein
MQKQLGIPDNAHWALVSLTTNALPDDLIILASSRDVSGRHGFETRFTGGSGGHYTGGEWRYDANHNHIIAVTNSGIKPTDALLHCTMITSRRSMNSNRRSRPATRCG